MTGREEIDHKNEAWIAKKLETLPQILSDYMLSIEKRKTSWSRRNYLGYLIQFFDFLMESGFDVNDVNSFAEIKPLEIQKYLKFISYRVVNGEKVENKAGIKAAKLFAVSDFFEMLVKNDVIDKNPCKKVDVPKDKETHEITYLTQDEIQTVKNNIMNRPKGRNKKYKNRDLCILTLGITTGIRVSALTEINIGDIDFTTCTIKVVEKGNISRVIHIGDKTKEIIKVWMDDRKKVLGERKCDALFINGSGNRLSTMAVRNMIKKDTVNIDKHITPHKMRSTCGTNVYNMTGDIYLTQEVLGHANIANTKRYAKVLDGKMEKAVSLMDQIV